MQKKQKSTKDVSTQCIKIKKLAVVLPMFCCESGGGRLYRLSTSSIGESILAAAELQLRQVTTRQSAFSLSLFLVNSDSVCNNKHGNAKTILFLFMLFLYLRSSTFLGQIHRHRFCLFAAVRTAVAAVAIPRYCNCIYAVLLFLLRPKSSVVLVTIIIIIIESNTFSWSLGTWRQHIQFHLIFWSFSIFSLLLSLSPDSLDCGLCSCADAFTATTRSHTSTTRVKRRRRRAVQEKQQKQQQAQRQWRPARTDSEVKWNVLWLLRPPLQHYLIVSCPPLFLFFLFVCGGPHTGVHCSVSFQSSSFSFSSSSFSVSCTLHCNNKERLQSSASVESVWFSDATHYTKRSSHTSSS